jgi:hypothetical protein
LYESGEEVNVNVEMLLAGERAAACFGKSAKSFRGKIGKKRQNGIKRHKRT